jgi:hypothetical protein
MTLKTFSNQVVAGLQIVQFTTDVKDTFPYLTSARALGQRLIEVREVSEQGNVNQLFVENPSESFIFFMDGDILAGAKQNRVLNTSVLIAPRSKTLVPVSCVEQGRWRSVSGAFSATNHSAPASLRAAKSSTFSRNREAKFMADQGGVWEQVAMLKASAGANAPTDSLSDVFAHKQSEFNSALEKLRHMTGANGLAVFSGERLVCFDVFNRTEALEDYLPRLLRGVLLDTASQRPTTAILSPEHLAARLATLIAGTALQASEPSPGAGVGQERRYEAADTVGFELMFERHPIHLSILGKPATQP